MKLFSELTVFSRLQVAKSRVLKHKLRTPLRILIHPERGLSASAHHVNPRELNEERRVIKMSVCMTLCTSGSFVANQVHDLNCHTL